MEMFLAIVGALGVLGTLVTIIINAMQLRRTPKPKREPEPFTPTSLTIIGVPMHRGPDLYGKDHWGSNG